MFHRIARISHTILHFYILADFFFPNPMSYLLNRVFADTTESPPRRAKGGEGKSKPTPSQGKIVKKPLTHTGQWVRFNQDSLTSRSTFVFRVSS